MNWILNITSSTPVDRDPYFNQLDRSPARNDLTPAEYWNEAV